MAREKVLLRRCEEYRADLIGGIIKEGMQELGARPKGRILLKPNVVLAHPEIFPHAFTRKEFLEGAVIATKQCASQVVELAVGERSGITIPTRYCFKNAGYPDVLKRHGVKIHYFDEVRQVPVFIKSEGRLRDRIYVPEPVAACDYLINLPKFKAHPWTRLTLSLKNYIGIQDDRHRLIDHNSFLEEKIADLQDVVKSNFIAIDGIIAGQKMMLTPDPFPLGVIVMGTNSCAVDTVGCHMVGVDPRDLKHLVICSQRGLGPMDIGEIEVAGDITLEEVREKTKEFKFCLERVDRYFPESGKIRCKVGTFPEGHSRDYCWGGCPGALQEAVHIFRGFDPSFESKMKPVRYVVGKVNGELDLRDDETVIFAGRCTSWEGEIRGKKVSINGNYAPRSENDTERTKSNDMLKRFVSAFLSALRGKRRGYLTAFGCPVSVSDHVHYLSTLGGFKNPMLDPRLSIPVNISYWIMRLRRMINRFTL
jgi:uncharacterized protein (DUF362 family)